MLVRMVKRFPSRLLFNNLLRRHRFSDSVVTNIELARKGNLWEITITNGSPAVPIFGLYRKVSFKFYLYVLYLVLFGRRLERPNEE